MPPATQTKFNKDGLFLTVVLLLAFANGLVYAFIIPPWQHYEEPNHFEYIWLLVARGERPWPGDYDTWMRREVALSMIDHGFFNDLAGRPDLDSEKPWIGRFPQLEEPQVYYQLAAIPLRLLPYDDVTTQLYLARMVSLVLFLVTVFAGWGLTAEITPAGHPLRLLVPLTMALLPGFVDLMTAVNNDVGAIAMFSLFLWGSTRLVRRGPAPLTLLWVLAATALCLFTKRTAYMAIPLLGVALLFGLLRGRFRRLAWGLAVAASIAGILAVFAWGDAATWYRDTLQPSATSRTLSQAPLGDQAFRLALQPETTDVKLAQVLPSSKAEPLSSVPVTLGAWIWASQSIEIQSPELHVFDGRQVYGQPVQVTQTPQFFAFNFSPTGKSLRAWVVLEPGKHLDLSAPVEIFYDGVVLAAGSFPVDQAPQFDPGGDSGTWGGMPFDNLVRNPSAEKRFFYLRPWADQLGSRFFSDYKGQESFSLTIYSLADWPVSQSYYRIVLESLFRSFWAKFGWGHVSLLGAKPYAWLLFPLTVLAAVGVVLVFWQQRQRLGKWPWDVIFLLGLTTLVVWGVTLLRGSTYLLTVIYVPVARYAYPAIIPTVVLMSRGWLAVLQSLEHLLRLPGWVKLAIYAAFFSVLNAYALVSIFRFYG